jgi:Cu-Zn family superoxide dismutase
MKRVWIVVAAASIVVAGLSYVTSGGEAGGSASQEGDDARSTLRNAAGVEVGSVKLEQEGDSVKLKVKVEGTVAPGFHGFHVHTTGNCAPFSSAGGHYNPDGAGVTHRNHAGDLPVLYVDTDGEAEARFSTDRFALVDLFDADGSAFILHANPDNYANLDLILPLPLPYGPSNAVTLATGDAGSRIACGVIE